MNIDYDRLKGRVDELSLDEIEIVHYNGRQYWVDLNCIPDPECGQPAEWFKSTKFSGADVYVWDNVEPEFKRAMALHEIIEADLKRHQLVPIEEAHRIAREHDKRYASETMDPVMLALFKLTSAQMEIKYGILGNAD